MRQSTSALILESARSLLQTKGFNAFSYADISENVGIRKASIHYHFPTKKALALALIAGYRQRVASELENVDSKHAAPIARLQALVDLYAGELKAGELCLCAMLGSDIEAVPEELREGVVAFYTETVAWIAKTIEAGCEDKSLKCQSPEDAAKALMGTMIGLQVVARASQWEPAHFAELAKAQAIAPLSA